ncbi:MAG: TIM barrel protein [Alphaproteobacteria bacterium]|nr:TIM barrel protein [Alphaproteobacteria bacterium]
MRFALNHITVPKMGLEEFFALAKGLDMTEVEIRNDLPNVVDSWKAKDVKTLAAKMGLTLLTINALYPFNQWSGELEAKAIKMADFAAESGAKALVMCPLNEGIEIAYNDLVAALRKIKPILDQRGILGYVEPLGFPVSSLRHKSLAIQAIKDISANDRNETYKLVHDTFHHHLAGESDFFPEWTGLVHISGVSDQKIAVDDMQDAHRVLIDSSDRLGNLAQMRSLKAAGYQGRFSFEPFAKAIHDLPNPEATLRESMEYMRAAL